MQIAPKMLHRLVLLTSPGLEVERCDTVQQYVHYSENINGYVYRNYL